jgi:hypothetical protein
MQLLNNCEIDNLYKLRFEHKNLLVSKFYGQALGLLVLVN